MSGHDTSEAVRCHGGSARGAAPSLALSALWRRPPRTATGNGLKQFLCAVLRRALLHSSAFSFLLLLS